MLPSAHATTPAASAENAPATPAADAEEWPIVDFCAHYGLGIVTVARWIKNPSEALRHGIKVEEDGDWVVFTMPTAQGMEQSPVANSATGHVSGEAGAESRG